MAVEFTSESGTTSFHDNATLVQLNDGRKVLASDLQDGDVFLIRRGEWSTVLSTPVVS